MADYAVVVARGGPTGLMLAGELAGVDVALVERRASHELVSSHAGGLHAHTIEVLDQRGIAERFLAEGQVAQVAGNAFTALFIAPSGGPPPWNVYRIAYHTVFGVASAKPYGATGWRFDR